MIKKTNLNKLYETIYNRNSLTLSKEEIHYGYFLAYKEKLKKHWNKHRTFS